MAILPIKLIQMLYRFYINSTSSSYSTIKKNQLKEPDPSKVFKPNAYLLGKEKINGLVYWTVQNKPKRYFVDVSKKKAIMYIHGGAFFLPITPNHFQYIKYMLKYIDGIFYIPIYPLANKNKSTFQSVNDFLLAVYKEMLTKHHPDTITIMGDSCGGTMSLSLFVNMNRNNLPICKNIIPISPCLNFNYSQKLLDVYGQLDPIITPKMFDFAYRWYFPKNIDYTDPLVSPIYGDYSKINNLLIISGSKEILNIAITEWIENNLEKNSIKHKYIIGKDMFHIYPLFVIYGVNEAITTTRKIISLINTNELK